MLNNSHLFLLISPFCIFPLRFACIINFFATVSVMFDWIKHHLALNVIDTKTAGWESGFLHDAGCIVMGSSSDAMRVKGILTFVCVCVCLCSRVVQGSGGPRRRLRTNDSQTERQERVHCAGHPQTRSPELRGHPLHPSLRAQVRVKHSTPPQHAKEPQTICTE